MKTNIFNKTFSIVLISILVLISSLSIVFATGLLSQQGNSLIILQAKATGSKNVKLTWETIDVKAESYTVYGALYDNKYKKIATTEDTKLFVKTINKKKLKAHKVYKFRVVADEIKSNNCIVIAGKTFGKKGKFSNPIKVSNALNNSTITLKPGEGFKLADLGLKTTIYKGKKHLGNKYGKKYSYLLSDNKAVSIKGKKIKVSSSVDKDTKATLYVQEINGVYTEITINIVVDKKATSDSATDGSQDGNGNPGKDNESKGTSETPTPDDVNNKLGGNALPIVFK